MRYDDDLTDKAVKSWAENYFEKPITVHNFSQNFLVTSKDKIILIRKICGTVEVKDI